MLKPYVSSTNPLDLGSQPTFDAVFTRKRHPLPDIIAAVKPFKMNERLTVQQGVFWVPKHPDKRIRSHYESNDLPGIRERRGHGRLAL